MYLHEVTLLIWHHFNAYEGNVFCLFIAKIGQMAIAAYRG